MLRGNKGANWGEESGYIKVDLWGNRGGRGE